MPFVANAYAIAVNYKQVHVGVEINGAPIVTSVAASGSGIWRLEPFVVEGTNKLELLIEDPQAHASVKAKVVESDGGPWATIAERDVAPAKSGRMSIEFAASDVVMPAAGTRLEALSGADRSAISAVLEQVHGHVSDDPDSSVLSLFDRWLDFHGELTGLSRSDLESTVLENLIALADPELSLASTSGADLRLVSGGSLCFPTGMDGRPALHASASGSGVAMRLVLSRLSGDWTIVG